MTKVRSGDGSMIDDRRGQGGGSLGGGLGSVLSGGGAMLGAGGGVLGVIVLLASLFLPKVLGGSSTDTFGSTGGQAAQSADGPCSDDLEQIVCGATLDVQTFWQTALPKFFGTTYQTTKTVLFAGGTSTGCGTASSQSGPFYCPADRLVYIDLDFMQQLEQQLVGATSDLAEQYIVAHEYGHHVQNLVGTNSTVTQAQQRDPSRANQYSVALELQADCYAGVWVNDVKARGLLDSSTEVDEALAAAAGVGDDRIQGGHADPDTFTHGTSQQRQTWFLRGFDSGDPRRCDTFSEIL
jgi:predicted metalloprotease